MLEDAETPMACSDYWTGYYQGCKETQETIKGRLIQAVNAEREILNARIKN
jgi:hypothetical protein